VCILRRGEVVVAGSLRDLLAEGKRRSEVTVGGFSDQLRQSLAPIAKVTRQVGDSLVMEVEGDAAVRAVVERVLTSYGPSLRQGACFYNADATEATVLWLRNNLPDYADEILARARGTYQGALLGNAS